ncbi:MAG TPA: ArsC/Spx/MgsR family protein [Bacteroidia bacterium]|jgi:arsenate reductase|nr:ArsC/Spx/MgsR family protein [Bacteroidia bacterium]HMU20193.1 ArsC/Spx/MgsR family protein [Bacteroidia bacterium]
MIRMYIKPTCSTCRTAMQMVKECAAEVEMVEYLIDTPSEEELLKLTQQLGVKPFDMVRTKESLYKEKYEGKKISDKQWLKILHKNPILIERPIITNGTQAVIGRPPSLIVDFLNKKQKTKKKSK